MAELSVSLKATAIGPSETSGAKVTDLSVFTRPGAKVDAFYYMQEPQYKAADGRTLLIFVQTLAKGPFEPDARATKVIVHGLSGERVVSGASEMVTWTEGNRIWSVSINHATAEQAVAIADSLVAY